MALGVSSASSQKLSITSGALIAIESDYTICGWVRPSSVGNDKCVVSLFAGVGGAYDAIYFYFSGSAKWLVDSGGRGGFTFGSAASVDTWAHVAMVRSGDDCRMYVNGVLDATSTAATGGRTTTEIVVGYRGDYSGSYADARYWGWKAWSRALTVAELTAEMRQAMPVSSQSLYGVWPFLAGATRAKDFSGKGHDWTETGTPTDEDPPNIAFGGDQPFAVIPVAAGTTYTMNVDAGSYAITGTSASLEWNRVMDAAPGSYSISGTSAGLEWNHVMDVTPGSYSITGTAVTFDRGIVMDVDPGVYTITGTGPSLEWNRVMPVDPGVYTITGTDPDLIYTTGAYTMNVDPGVYSITGSEARFFTSRGVVSYGPWSTEVGLVGGDQWYVTLSGPSADAPRCRVVVTFK